MGDIACVRPFMPSPSPVSTTETLSPRYVDLDAWPSLDALDAMLESQLAAVAAIRPALPALAEAVEAAAKRLGATGRLVYVGAGTSGRIGVQDGVELTPTFDWPPERMVFAMAGGEPALLRSVENAEDDVEGARARMEALGIGRADVVIGVAASGTTPYTVAAIEAARARGALTIAVASNPGAPLLAAARHAILVETGPEVVAGSTRMKAGTAQKVVLNLFSTQVMVRLGRVYKGLMVHMRPTNAKLRIRGARMVERIVGCDADSAARAFEASGGDVKVALLVANGLTAARARAVLAKNEGDVRAALSEAAFGAGAIEDDFMGP